MNTKTCPTCGHEIPLDAMRCINCGSILLATGRLGERGISRTRAIVASLILLAFPLCCLLSVGYRLVNDGPADYGALFGGEESEPTDPSSNPIGDFLDSVFGREDDAVIVVIEENPPTATDQDAPEITEAPVPSDTAVSLEQDLQVTDAPVSEAAAGFPDIPELACVPRDTDQQVAEVIQVIDGDEIRVRIGGEEAIVRYIGILAPELNEPFGAEASNENIYQVFSKDVVLVRDITDRDSEGRLLRYVILGDRLVNHDLVRKGFAQAENVAPDTACSDLLQRAEAEAQQEMAGMWKATPEPTRTWAPLWTDTPDPTEKQAKRGKANCDCDGPDLNCGDFPNDNEAQLCYMKCFITHGDVFDLDSDGNGVACDE